MDFSKSRRPIMVRQFTSRYKLRFLNLIRHLRLAQKQLLRLSRLQLLINHFTSRYLLLILLKSLKRRHSLSSFCHPLILCYSFYHSFHGPHSYMSKLTRSYLNKHLCLLYFHYFSFSHNVYHLLACI